MTSFMIFPGIERNNQESVKLLAGSFGTWRKILAIQFSFIIVRKLAFWGKKMYKVVQKYTFLQPWLRDLHTKFVYAM